MDILWTPSGAEESARRNRRKTEIGERLRLGFSGVAKPCARRLKPCGTTLEDVAEMGAVMDDMDGLGAW